MFQDIEGILISHIPSNKENVKIDIPKENPHGQIPGYSGYIKYVKPENIYGKSYGVITYEINTNKIDQNKNNDLENIYKSTYNEIHFNQNNALQRTAAELVGIKPKETKINIKEDDLNMLNGTVKLLNEGEKLRKLNEINNNNCGKSKNNFIPGYTGHLRRVQADNIYGVTFGNSKKLSEQNQEKIEKKNKKNLKKQDKITPNFKKIM